MKLYFPKKMLLLSVFTLATAYFSTSYSSMEKYCDSLYAELSLKEAIDNMLNTPLSDDSTSSLDSEPVMLYLSTYFPVAKLLSQDWKIARVLYSNSSIPPATTQDLDKDNYFLIIDAQERDNETLIPSALAAYKETEQNWLNAVSLHYKEELIPMLRAVRYLHTIQLKQAASTAIRTLDNNMSLRNKAHCFLEELKAKQAYRTAKKLSEEERKRERRQ